MATDPDPAARLRALVQEGIVAAAALNARDDLELAAASTQRLGALSSGMWRALSRELATAAERLDHSTLDRLEDIERRARSLDVDPQQVVAVGVAAGHLAEHLETLETLVKPGQDAHRLLGANMLFGFTVETVEEEDLSDEEPEPRAVEVALFLWPAPLSPAIVSIVPSLLPGATPDTLEAKDVSLGLALTSPLGLVDALTTATELSVDDLNQALSALAVACWTAHHFDEDSLDDDDDEDTDDAAEDDDDGPGGVDRG